MFESLNIQRVHKNTKLTNKLLDYIENFSWEEVKKHVLWMIKNWNFKEWETPFVALIGDRIVGMATIMRSDYYPLPEVYPWISSIFVSEEYRSNRISEKLIDYANKYAKMIGFDKTYIPTKYIGLYEKYGYYYIKDIVNYGNEIDRLYVKKLK